MRITAPKFEAVFNKDGQLFRLLQDSFHPTEYVDSLIAEKYAQEDFITYIIDDALVHYMKTSFKRLREGRRNRFPNYEIIGLSKSGYTPFDVPTSKIGTTQAFEARISKSAFVCGSTQLKRKMVLSTMLDLKRKYDTKEVLFFVAYSDETLADFASQNDLPVALMAADMSGPMSAYFGPWYDWYYLRCSHQDKMDLALVNSRTCELYIPSAYKAGIGDHSYFKRDHAVEDWIATNTSLTAGQARNTNVLPDFGCDVEAFIAGEWRPVPDVDINWGGLGRGREDSFGLCSTTQDYGTTLVLRVKTAVKGLYFCGIFMRYTPMFNVARTYNYTPLPVKNQVTLNAINECNAARFE